ncbi:MAG: hypothetical protein CMD26_01390 [Flavobacteriales bacterium]|nr:hypothetical protein [Flavobacteriales bacterium]|tara:strand:- start:7163 stop:7447 length:285 start_codon:yes stop_codon:yes gene_type:complete
MRRSLKTKRFSDLFDDFIRQKKHNHHREKTLSSIWENVVGYNILIATQNISLNNNTLCIIITDPKVKNTLILQKRELLQKIQRFNPRISSLVIK